MSVQSTVFRPVVAADRVDYPELERTIQRWWDANNVRQSYLKRNEHSHKQYAFLDGPITANNPMGVHHAWGRTYKDLYQRLKPCRAINNAIKMASIVRVSGLRSMLSRRLGYENKRDIEEYGIARFVEDCKERVYTLLAARRNNRFAWAIGWTGATTTIRSQMRTTIRSGPSSKSARSAT